MRPSRYQEGFDYDHRFHAGNVGDALKHVALLCWIEALRRRGAAHILDTHAGAGVYALPAQGEWQQGVGRLDGREDAPPAVARYLQAAGKPRRPGKGGLYPGSPAFTRGAIGPEDHLTLVEMMEAPRAKLEAHYADDAQVTVRDGDGLAALVELAATANLAALIDPAYTSKAEWSQVSAALIEALRINPALPVLLWYPIKSLMRPQALAAELRAAGLRGARVDLITTPLRLKRKALNGSGLLLLNPPEGLLEALGGLLPWLGAALSEAWEAQLGAL